MEKERVEFLNQVIKSLRQASDSLDESYKRNDPQNFNKAKKLILQIQEKISEIIK